MYFCQKINKMLDLDWDLEERIDQLRSYHPDWFKNWELITCIENKAILFVENIDPYLVVILYKREDGYPDYLTIVELIEWLNALVGIFYDKRFWVKLICDIYEQVLENEKNSGGDRYKLIENLNSMSDSLSWKYMAIPKSRLVGNKQIKELDNFQIFMIVFGSILCAARRIADRGNSPITDPWTNYKEKVIMYPALHILINPKCKCIPPPKKDKIVLECKKDIPIRTIVDWYAPISKPKKERELRSVAMNRIKDNMCEVFDKMNICSRERYDVELNKELSLV